MNKKVLELLAGTLKLDAEVLAKSLSSENEDETLELPKGSFLSETDLQTLKDNHGKERYDAGATASREKFLKEIADEIGFERTKDKEDFVKNFKSKVLEEANVEPQKQVEELNQSLEKLRSQLTEKDTAYSELENTVKKDRQRLQIHSLIPDLPETLGLSKDEATSLFFMNFDVKEDGVYDKSGKLLKDQLENPLTPDKVVSQYVEQKGWTKPEPSGRGGGAKGQGGKSGINSMQEYESYLQEKGLHAGSAEAQSVLQQAIADNPDNFNE